MKKYLLATIVLCALLVFAAQSHALLLNPGHNCLYGDQNKQPDIDLAIAGTIVGAEFLYKNEVDGGIEYGPLAGSYQTTYLDTPSDPSGAKIEYTGGDIVGDPAFLLVKDGDHSPAWYLFCLTAFGWNGTDILELSGFWPSQGAISHVTLYGGRQVPEPATMLLLGSGLIVLGVFGRKKLFKK